MIDWGLGSVLRFALRLGVVVLGDVDVDENVDVDVNENPKSTFKPPYPRTTTTACKVQKDLYVRRNMQCNFLCFVMASLYVPIHCSPAVLLEFV